MEMFNLFKPVGLSKERAYAHAMPGGVNVAQPFVCTLPLRMHADFKPCHSFIQQTSGIPTEPHAKVSTSGDHRLSFELPLRPVQTGSLLIFRALSVSLPSPAHFLCP